MGANAGAIKAGAAYVELFLKDNRFTKGLQAASKTLDTWGKGIAKAGAAATAVGSAVVAPLLGAAKVLADMAGPLADMSARTGIGVEALQELGYAAQMGGASLEAVEAGVRKMQKNLVEAAGGSKTAAEAFEGLGLSVSYLQTLAPEDQFKAVAQALSEIDDPAKKTAATMEILGKSGTALLPIIADGADGLDKFAQAARAAGLVLSKEDVEAADTLGDSLDTLWASMKTGYAKVGAALAPMLTDFAEKVTSVVATVGNWIRENPELVKTIFLVASGVAVAGAALSAIGGVLVGLGMTLAAVGGAFAALATFIGTVVIPVGLVLGGASALAYGLMSLMGTTELVGDALRWLQSVIGELVDDFKTTFQGIADALTAGDLALAAKILWATLKMEWQKGTAALNEVWIGAKLIFKNVWAEAFYWIAETWVKATSWMESAWVNFSNAVVTGWKKAEKTVATGVAWIIAKIEGLDPDQVLNTLEEDYGRAQAARDKTAADRTSNIDATRAGALAQLEADKARELAANQEAAAAALKGGPEELERLKRERQALLDEAAAKAEEARNKGGPNKPKLPGPPEMEAMGAAMKGPQGTFSGAAAAMMGWTGQSHGERIARATERTAEACEELTEDEMLWGE